MCIRDSLYRAEKKEKNVVDFSDIEHYAYEILKNDEASDFYRAKFEHIFIDEDVYKRQEEMLAKANEEVERAHEAAKEAIKVFRCV